MSEQATSETGEGQPLVRSGVRVSLNSKSQIQVAVSVYSGETEEEMQRLKDLAVRTYETTVNELAARNLPAT